MDQYVGEIRMFAGTYAPLGWAFCDGQLLRIQDNSALFALIGTRYGGDGMTTFALPDLRGRVPVHMGAAPGGSTYPLGSTGGVESVNLTPDHLPPHGHPVACQAEAGTTESPEGAVWAVSGQNRFTDTPTAVMSPTAITPAGGSQSHANLMPYLPVNFIIALEGIFPPRT